jgi:hypothetical protein
MNLRNVADLAVARLGLPIPMAKLATIGAIAQALDGPDTATTFALALADWAGSCELESECLEAICPLLISEPKPEAIALVRQAIGRPSIASDALLSLATGSPTLVQTWTGCHSGPALHHVSLDDEEAQLRSGQFIPPLFTELFESLERDSRYPFIRQWAYEFKMLADRCGFNDDGYLNYFVGTDRGHVAQFVTKRSHLARSAFLRTLACAVDHWNMPVEIASHFAEATFPAEPIFLRFPPQRPPEWAQVVQRNLARDTGDVPAFVETVIQSLESNLGRNVLHCSLSVVDEPRCHSELEVFLVAGAEESLEARQAFHFYKYLPGKVTPERDCLKAFFSPDLGSDTRDRLGFMPLAIPLVGTHIGYLHSDLVTRIPYVPVASVGLPNVNVVSVADRASLRDGDIDIGSWHWWRWNWRPSHVRDQPAPIASCTSLSKDAVKQLAGDLAHDIEHVWRLTTWTRDTDYGEWSEEKTYGRRRS